MTSAVVNLYIHEANIFLLYKTFGTVLFYDRTDRKSVFSDSISLKVLWGFQGDRVIAARGCCTATAVACPEKGNML